MKFTSRIVLFLVLITSANTFGQVQLSNEIGLNVGPVTMQTDYGERHHLPSSTATSFGIALTHYLSFYGTNYNWRNGASFFSDHFKLRSEISYYFNNSLEHKGTYVEDNGHTEVDKLRAMKGSTKIFNIGTQLEFYFKNLEDYGLLFNDDEKFAPYVGLGIFYNSFTPDLTSDLGDWRTNPSVLPEKWANDGVFIEKDNTFSLTMNAGTRYKINDFDLTFDARWQYFFSDNVDGLNANDTGDKFNDTLIYFSVGVVFDLDVMLGNY